MIEEPEITPDDTHPTKPVSVDDKLRAEEPPVEQEDTSPSRPISVHQRLSAEEPPIIVDDTSPSLVSRQFLTEEWPPKPARSAGGQRALAFLMLIGAVVLTSLAGYIWMSAEEDTTGDQADSSIAQNPTLTATARPTLAASATPRPTEAPPQTAAPSDSASVFPTAAADEIAVALLNPVPAAPLDKVIPRDSAPFTIRPFKSRTEVIQYTVNSGDTLESIASNFGLTDIYSLVWANKKSKIVPLRPGNQLNILPQDGVYLEVTEPVSIGTVAEQFKVDPFAIIDSEYNDLFGSSPDTLLVKGMWVVIPGGEAERVNLLPPNPNVNAGGASGVVTGTYSLWGCSADVQGGSPPYSRPIANYQWMQGYSPDGHQGVDLAADIGTPVYASGGGTVVFAGSNGTGYGNLVVIAHGSAFSMYGHLNNVSVRCGQQVSAGAAIGASGNTGNSTGPHLHFEIRDANWNTRNPQDFVGF